MTIFTAARLLITLGCLGLIGCSQRHRYQLWEMDKAWQICSDIYFNQENRKGPGISAEWISGCLALDYHNSKQAVEKEGAK